MKLKELIASMQLVLDKHGDLEVFYRHGASGDCGPVGSGIVTDRTDDQGPFDLEPKQKYFSLYVGN